MELCDWDSVLLLDGGHLSGQRTAFLCTNWYTPIPVAQPNNVSGSEGCIKLAPYSDYKWSDASINCSVNICEAKLSKDNLTFSEYDPFRRCPWILGNLLGEQSLHGSLSLRLGDDQR